MQDQLTDVAAPRRRRRVVIESSSSSDEDDELLFSQFPSKNGMYKSPRNETINGGDREDLLPKQANAISELEISIASLRLVDRPNSKNRVVVNKEQPFVDKHVSHGGATDKVVTNQTGDDTWAYNESIKEYTLPRPRMESAEQWPIVRIPKSLYDKLFDFQRTGVCWMALLHAKRIGGILGDDMGMGKTYTTLAFLGGLLKGGMIKNALIVSPVTVLRSWESEAHKIIESCISGVNISVVSSDNSKNERNRLLREGYESLYQPHIVITSFGLVSSAPDEFIPTDNRENFWDYVVLDEGHTIKNHKARVSQNCRKIGADERTRLLLLTGTPIMNRLDELWALVDFVAKSNVFPALHKFRERFAKPIEAARHKDACDSDIRHGERASKELQEMLRPFFLQRLKIDFLRDRLPIKRELVIWTHLSAKQRNLYQNYISSNESVASILSGETSTPLEAITWLKKLCGHPLLGGKKSDGDFSNAVLVTDPSDLVEQSAKLEILVSLIQRLRQAGHKSLIFSQSTKMLDIIQRVLGSKQINLGRIDGNTKERDRQRLVDIFNSGKSAIDAMLLSTKAAGVGLTLIGADRAVIYDPSWNPAEDAQAVDRCYRIGQRSEVTVYRLIAAGTVEEKMYEKQIHKDGIRRAVTTNSGNNTERYFERNEMRKLFSLAPAGVCEVLSKVSSQGNQIPVGSSGKPTFLADHRGVVGVSSHDGLYTDKVATTAFDGTPTKGKPFEGSAPLQKFLGKSQRALLKPSKKEQAAAAQDANDARGRVLTTASTNRLPGPFKETDGVLTLFRKADSLRNKGELTQGLGVLLHVLGGKVEIAPEEKKELHLRIATFGNEMGWLHESK